MVAVHGAAGRSISQSDRAAQMPVFFAFPERQAGGSAGDHQVAAVIVCRISLLDGLLPGLRCERLWWPLRQCCRGTCHQAVKFRLCPDSA